MPYSIDITIIICIYLFQDKCGLEIKCLNMRLVDLERWILCWCCSILSAIFAILCVCVCVYVCVYVCVCPAFTEQEPAYYTNGLSYMLEGRVKFMRPHKVKLRFIFLGEWPVKDSWFRVSTQSTSEPNAYVKYLNVHFVTIPIVPLYWMN
jgi:hypothetical protein